VGRETELGHLHRALAKALGGLRQVLFVTGEAGLGKTTLIEAFLKEAGSRDSLWIGRGQCLDHYGTDEAYMPVLETLGRLCRGPEGRDLIALLGGHAPTWLVQIPGLVSATHLRALQHSTLGVTRERMLREMAVALEVLTAEQVLVLVLEDLHWSDYATLDLVAALARRRESARLLLLGTYRPEEATMSRHALHTVKQELQLHGRCEELPLTFLSETARDSTDTPKSGRLAGHGG
jgi:predicted ATPase